VGKKFKRKLYNNLMTEQGLIEFWRKSAENDLKVAEDNLKLGHYHWALLPTHNLGRLASEAKIDLSEEQAQDFKEITSYNIEARYDDIKLSFYKKATKEYALKWVKKCRECYLWLKKI